MTTALLSPKYQIVIPKEIRKSMDLQPGQRLQLVEKDGIIEIRPILTPDQLIGYLKDCAHIPFKREKTDRELP
ncbi:MAG TPA: AbrB/MazE/SpoVT family DNA-binding domain-containing protein [Verrucomicrobiales bacterium]|nr:AbrB/MazE/SpoVT family DNA-binding domain-containing protein [Verrucomicrobiae bacterium]MCP5553883.1 AbrB/MazE/SpoVT family DNA-binding domain-containing protein [Akkermansiaceae bacterium]HRX55549.1 AbrB/MazE/SpoVT family DNA-binding domain-containing protein [Verrucomicrobiales bacterium]